MSVHASMNFEYMYSPTRARNLYSRHRELTHGCEKQKTVLDWEKHTVMSQMDKEQVRFTQRATKIFAHIPELKEKVEQFNCRRACSAIDRPRRGSPGLPVIPRPATSQSQRRDTPDGGGTPRSRASSVSYGRQLSRQSLVKAQKDRFSSIQKEVHSDTRHLDTKIKQFVTGIEGYKREYKESLEKNQKAAEQEPEPPKPDPSNQKGLNNKGQLGPQLRMFAMAAMMQAQRMKLQEAEKEEAVESREQKTTLTDDDKAEVKRDQQSTETSEAKEPHSLKAAPTDIKRSVEFTDTRPQQANASNGHLNTLKPVNKVTPSSDKRRPRKVRLNLAPKPDLKELYAPSKTVMCEAWETFTKDINVDNMRRLSTFASTNKAKLHKERSTPTMLRARRAIQAFKELVLRARRRKAALEEGETVDEETEPDLQN